MYNSIVESYIRYARTPEKSKLCEPYFNNIVAHNYLDVETRVMITSLMNLRDTSKHNLKSLLSLHSSDIIEGFLQLPEVEYTYATLEGVINTYLTQKAVFLNTDLDILKNTVFGDTHSNTLTDKLVGFSWDNLKEASGISLFPKECFTNTKPVPTGTFIVIGSKTNIGKTSYILYNLLKLAQEGHKCLLINTERSPQSIQARMVSVVYGKDWSVVPKSKVKEVTKLIDSIDLAHITDYLSISKVDFSDYDIVFIDILDLLLPNKDTKELNKLYQECQIKAVNENCIIVGTSQLAAEANDILYPAVSCLENSKVGKGAAADIVITLSNGSIAHLEDDQFSILGINTPKNKFSKGSNEGYLKLDKFSGRFCKEVV